MNCSIGRYATSKYISLSLVFVTYSLAELENIFHVPLNALFSVNLVAFLSLQSAIANVFFCCCCFVYFYYCLEMLQES